jgi:hypothetical protein
VVGPASIRRSKQSTHWRKRNKSDAEATVEQDAPELWGVATKSVQETGM